MSRCRSWLVFTAAVAVLVVAGCAPREEAPVAEEITEVVEQPVAAPVTALATLTGRAGSEVAGTVSFTPVGDTVQIVADLSGTPPGPHGFHLHAVGDCSAEDFTSAKGHFNPTGASHGCPGDPEHHAGDLGNIEIADDGSGRLEIASSMISLEEGAENSVIGRAVILHEKPDDCLSQPTGDAGSRLACGVIGLEETGETGGEQAVAQAEE
jgi:Cu-Zn family superoxide dismutase